MNIWTAQSRFQRDQRRAFTLVELLVVITIITLISSITLVTFYGVQEDAKERRARTQIAKIHEVLMQKWESYRTRPVPVQTRLSGMNPVDAAGLRLAALRQLMRMELPDRKTDLMAAPLLLKSPPAIWSAYIRRARQQIIGKNGLDPTDPANQDVWMLDTGWTPENQHAECLYLILAAVRDGDTTGLDFFNEDEIGDADGDGMSEILDPWGVPIAFLRWAPGFVSDVQQGDVGVNDSGAVEDGNAGNGNGDPFDPLKVDPRWRDGEPNNDPFLLLPLAISAGRDKQFGILRMFAGVDPNTPPSPYIYDDPYAPDPAESSLPQITLPQIGTVTDQTYADNITNHFVEVR